MTEVTSPNTALVAYKAGCYRALIAVPYCWTRIFVDFEIITFGTLVVGNFMKNEWLDILEVFAKRKQGSRVFDPVKFVHILDWMVPPR